MGFEQPVMLEYWNIGMLGKSKNQRENIESFWPLAFWVTHYSIIPLFKR